MAHDTSTKFLVTGAATTDPSRGAPVTAPAGPRHLPGE